MATLYVAEYAEAAKVGDRIDIPDEGSLIAEQTVAIGGSSVEPTNVFNDRTRFVRINADVACSIAFGTNPTATASKKRLSAGQTEYFGIPAGKKWTVAVITNT